MNINVALNHVKPVYTCKETGLIVRSSIICRSGLCISVQASGGHYCLPKRMQKYHNSFELLCTLTRNIDIKLLEPYYNGTIYSYVPKTVVELLILSNGGIDWNKTLKIEKEKNYAGIYKHK